MQELNEFEEERLRNMGYLFDHNESVGKKRDELGWSNIRKENDQFVIRGSVYSDGRKQEFIRFYETIDDILNGKESTRNNNDA